MGRRDRTRRRAQSQAPDVDDLLRTAAAACARGMSGHRSRAETALRQCPSLEVATAAERLLTDAACDLWPRGWQPAEAVRQVRRKGDALATRLFELAVLADHANRDPGTMHPDWKRQIDDLTVPPAPAGWWIATTGDADPLSISATVEALAVTFALGVLPTILPPPGTSTASATLTSLLAHGGGPTLEKVRALLAKAESSTFDAEAQAFTAKAQELMARHAIDEAIVWNSTRRGEVPITIRLPIDDPYATPKAMLLQYVAEHSRCQAIRHSDCAMSAVVGFADDVAATELLFTSLLVQAQSALGEAATNAPPGSRTRSRGFRSSFLMAYAQRIGDRLADINREVVTEAEAATGTSLVPVLAAREEAVDKTIDEIFGHVRSTRVSGGVDVAGAISGRQAADQAEITQGALVQ